MPSSLMEAIFARDSMRIPSALSLAPPDWNAFSTAMAAPTTRAPDCSTMLRSPSKAAPFARKSSTMSTLSSGLRYDFDTMTV